MEKMQEKIKESKSRATLNTNPSGVDVHKGDDEEKAEEIDPTVAPEVLDPPDYAVPGVIITVGFCAVLNYSMQEMYVSFFNSFTSYLTEVFFQIDDSNINRPVCIH